jgi:hypothetical protein
MPLSRFDCFRHYFHCCHFIIDLLFIVFIRRLPVFADIFAIFTLRHFLRLFQIACFHYAFIDTPFRILFSLFALFSLLRFDADFLSSSFRRCHYFFFFAFIDRYAIVSLLIFSSFRHFHCRFAFFAHSAISIFLRFRLHFLGFFIAVIFSD